MTALLTYLLAQQKLAALTRDAEQARHSQISGDDTQTRRPLARVLRRFRGRFVRSRLGADAEPAFAGRAFENQR